MKQTPISTVGRKRSEEVTDTNIETPFHLDNIHLWCGDSLDVYDCWESPDVIVSDGAYGILGFEGDTIDHLEIPDWYEAHIRMWSLRAKTNTTLWFWNSEIGWAAANPILEKYGWRYQNCNIWDKGLAHIAGNVNTQKIRRFPVVSEVCVQYVRENTIDGKCLKAWLKSEWQRSGLPLRKANEACGLKDAAVRKYLDQSHLWYFPPADMFERLQEYANKYGKIEGRPYYSIDGKQPLSGAGWAKFRSKFNCPHGYTNVWSRPPVSGQERVKNKQGKALHLNQKPLDLMKLIINASSEYGDVIWEPFGGLFSASVAGSELGRRVYGAEIDPYYYSAGIERFKNKQPMLL